MAGDVMYSKLFSNDDICYFKRSLKYLLPYWFRFFLFTLLCAFSIALSFIKPLVYGYFITALYKQDLDLLRSVVGYWSLVNSLSILINWIKSRMSIYLQNNILLDIRKDIFSKMMIIPLNKFEEISPGKFISLLYNDASIISNILNEGLLGFILDILSLVIVGFIIFRTSFILGLIILFFSPITFSIFMYLGKVLKQKSAEYKVAEDSYIAKIQQSIQGIREIKAMGIAKRMLELFLHNTIEIRNKRIGMSMSSINIQPLMSITSIIQYASIMCVGAYLIFNKSLPIELFIAFLSYSDRFSGSLISISSLNSEVQQVLVSMGRVFGLLDMEDEINYSGKIISGVKGKIECHNINFSYDNTKCILNSVTFTANPHCITAIIGRSGSGKTTILNLILKLYKPQQGKILIDNNDISEMDDNLLRQNISIVNQEPFLFNMTIKENFLLVKNDATDEEIYKCCKMSYIHDDILRMPNGYDTVIGEGGANISVGQKQRIALARALLKNARIILFDEVTSALDNESQFYINRTIKEISRRHTIVMIAHNLVNISSLVDRIILIDKGRVEAIGTHKQLLKCSGMYSQLYNKESENIAI